MAWQDWSDSRIGRLVDGGDYSVLIFGYPGGLRYSEQGRRLTLLIDWIDETEKLGKTWLFFPTLINEVYLPEILKWDDGREIDQPGIPKILNRIERALKYRRSDLFRFETCEKNYQDIRQAWERFGRKN